MIYFHHGRACQPGFRGRRGGFAGRWTVHMEGTGDGRRRGRVFDGGELRLVLLKLIADKPRHGYDLIREIEQMTGGAYAPSPGIVYPTITLLDDMGLIDEQHAEAAKKQFAATDAGHAHLEERKDEVGALFARLSALAAERSKVESASVRRAMGNLRSVLLHKLMSGDVDKETLHLIVALIDEAAQKIERLD